MRENARITFIKQDKPYYDPEKGKTITPEPIKTPKPCHISDLELRRSVEIFGDYENERKVARLRFPHLDEFDYVEYNEQRYKPLQEALGGKVLYLERDNIG